MSRRPAPQNPSPPAVDMRNPRINRESADDRRAVRAPAPARTPSRDERAPAVAADTSRSASYFGTASAPLRPPLRTSLEQHNPWHPSPPAYSSTAAPASHHLSNVAMHTSQGPNVGRGSSSIAAPDAPVLQWGHVKRPRSRRGHEAPAPEPEPEPLPAAEVQALAEAAKLIPPPGARVPNPSAAAAASSLRTSMEELHIAASEQQPKPLPAKEKKQPQRAEVEKPKLPPSNHAPIMIRGTSPLPPGTTTIPHRRSAEEPQAAAAAGGEQVRLELEAKWEPKPPQQRRQQPQRRASEAEKGKASLHRSEEEPRTNEQEPMPKEEKQQPQGEEVEKLMLHRSAEQKPAAKEGEQKPAAKEGKQQPQRQASSKEKGKAMMMEAMPHVEEKAEQQPKEQPQRQAPKKKKAMAPMVEVPPHIAEKAAAAGAAAVAAIWGPEQAPKINTQLTRDEIEQDWLAMTGTKLPTRPKIKRSKKAQRRVDDIYPGFSTISMADYDVDEKPEMRGPGLKGLAMIDSDSD